VHGAADAVPAVVSYDRIPLRFYICLNGIAYVPEPVTDPALFYRLLKRFASDFHQSLDFIAYLADRDSDG
jgi:hypothetical protein